MDVNNATCDECEAVKCRECASEHRQLAEWLKELKAYKEQIGDAISRQAVLDAFWKLNVELSPTAIWTIQNMVKGVPSVTPQQKMGRWIKVIDEIDNLGNETWHHECSICGNGNSGWGKNKYCPDCGTKMEVEE